MKFLLLGILAFTIVNAQTDLKAQPIAQPVVLATRLESVQIAIPLDFITNGPLIDATPLKVDGIKAAQGGIINGAQLVCGACRLAYTWSVSLVIISPTLQMVKVTADASSNPYVGDTPTTTSLPIICVSKSGAINPDPSGVYVMPHYTPGGAYTGSWVGGEVAFTTPILGYTLTSLAVANAICANQFGPTYRMGEHHDGQTGFYDGWGFWGNLKSVATSQLRPGRFWTAIIGQPANPWS